MLLFMSFIMIACSGEEDKKDSSGDSRSKKDNSSKTEDDRSYSSSDWSDYQIQEMVDECVREGAPSVDVCECMVFALSDVFTYSEFKSMEDKSDNEITDSERAKTQEFMMMMECMPK